MQRVQVQLRADHVVKLSNSADCSGLVISNGDDEEFFCAKDDFYGVKSHRLRLAREGRLAWIIHEGTARGSCARGIAAKMLLAA